LAIVNNTALNMGAQVCLLYPDIQSFEYMPTSGIAGSYDSSLISLLSYLHTAFCMVALI
jgi:signal transduction protein with GAF and PtsI domain